MTEAQKKEKTLIGDDIEVVGSIKSASNVDFQGKLNGDLSCAGNALISETASIKGNISVKSATVHGQVNGNITAKEKVQLKSTAKVTGDIKAKSMMVEDGVMFVGKSEVNASGRSSVVDSTLIQEILPGNDDIGDDARIRDKKEEIRKNVKEEVKNKSGGFFGKK